CALPISFYQYHLDGDTSLLLDKQVMHHFLGRIFLKKTLIVDTILAYVFVFVLLHCNTTWKHSYNLLIFHNKPLKNSASPDLFYLNLVLVHNKLLLLLLHIVTLILMLT